MKQLTRLSVLAIIVMLLGACEEEVDPGKLGIQDQLLVVNSLIAQGRDTVFVQVSMSRPLFGVLPQPGSTDDLVTDAVVTMTNESENRTASLTYSPELGLYWVRGNDMRIFSGVTYSLRVEAGEHVATARCTVPLPVRLLDVRLVPGDDIEQRVVLGWLDPGNTVNYYGVRAALFNDQGDLYTTAFFDEEEYHSDITTNGGGFSARGDIYLPNDLQGFDQLVGELISCDENYYLYHRNRNTFTEDDPFSEPGLTHTNIEGGTGIFGAFAVWRRVLTLD